LEQAVEERERRGKAIAADELNCFEHLCAALAEALYFGGELVWLLAIVQGVSNCGHATSKFASGHFQPVHVGFEVAAGQALGGPVTQAGGGLVGLLLSLAGLVHSEFEPGTGIRRINLLGLAVDALATGAAQAEGKDHEQRDCGALPQRRSAALTGRIRRT
jgi:hypothetical protein